MIIAETRPLIRATLTAVLTDSKPRLMLCPLSPLAKVGIRTPRIGEKSPLILAVFLCPVIQGAGLIRASFVMVGCLRETLKSLARAYTGSSNLIQSTARCFEPNGSGTPSLIGVTTMSHQKYTQPIHNTKLTTYRYSKDPLGYDIRILCDMAGCDIEVNPQNAAPDVAGQSIAP